MSNQPAAPPEASAYATGVGGVGAGAPICGATLLAGLRVGRPVELVGGQGRA